MFRYAISKIVPKRSHTLRRQVLFHNTEVNSKQGQEE